MVGRSQARPPLGGKVAMHTDQEAKKNGDHRRRVGDCLIVPCQFHIRDEGIRRYLEQEEGRLGNPKGRRAEDRSQSVANEEGRIKRSVGVVLDHHSKVSIARRSQSRLPLRE